MSAYAGAKYETLGEIGRGGMATVFAGRARGAAGFQRLVAIKRSHAHLRGEAGAALRREAEHAARLHHPNVVRVLDVLDEEGELALVLDYVDGGSLTDLLRVPDGQDVHPLLADPRARARVVLRIALDVAAGLDAAHRTLADDGTPAPIIHRDLSPGNVLVGVDGVARLTDFGIAKALEDGRDLTVTGELKGKIAYMAPEYVEHQRVDAASDQFSFAIVVWEALAGRRLFRGPTDLESLKRVVAARVPPLADVDASLAVFDPVLSRALARSSADRYPSVGALADALEAAGRGADLVATPREVGDLVTRVLGNELVERRRWSSLAPASAAPSGLVATPRGRDEATRTNTAGAAPVSAERRRGPSRFVVPAIAMAALLVVVVVGLVRARAPAAQAEPTSATIATASVAASAPPATEPSAELAETVEPPQPGATAPSRPTRTAAPGRRAAPPPGGKLVPKKAPPNPYVH